MPVLNALAATIYSGDRTFADLVHFVHVYMVEAHPQAPDPSPFNGIVSEMLYSSVGQARYYEARVDNARQSRALIEDNQIQLVDALDTRGLINPVWCTYGPSPNGTYLIDQEGIIRYSEDWAFGYQIEAEMRLLLGERMQ